MARISLSSTTKYQNIISQVIFTLNNEEDGLWYLESKMGKGESCSEREMLKLLESRFLELND